MRATDQRPRNRMNCGPEFLGFLASYPIFFCFFHALYSASETSPFSCRCFIRFFAFLISKNKYMVCTTNVIRTAQ